MILKGMNKTFDALPSPYHMGDVSFTLLAATFKNALKEDFQPDKDLLSTTLVTEDGQVTNGGLLLCDQGRAVAVAYFYLPTPQDLSTKSARTVENFNSPGAVIFAFWGHFGAKVPEM